MMIEKVEASHICLVYVATSGLNGLLMGSDEQDIILLTYVIINEIENTIVGERKNFVHLVKDENFNFEKEVNIEDVKLDQIVEPNNKFLENAVKDFDEFCKDLNINPNHSGFRFITNGQLPLRQCLHPEAYRKQINLPFYYTRFHDLSKEIEKFCGYAMKFPNGIADMLDYLQITTQTTEDFYETEVKNIVNIVRRLIEVGHKFELMEYIELNLEYEICLKSDKIDNRTVVWIRGLPWHSGDQDIANFFRGLNIVRGGVALCLSETGVRNGEAYVRFESPEHRDMALKRHKHHLESRYIEVFPAAGENFLAIAAVSNAIVQNFLSRGAPLIVRMRGLPFGCTHEQIIEFFASGKNPCNVLNNFNGILLVTKWDGRATGDAFVLFGNESDLMKALSKHRESIGFRYVEIYKVTAAEVLQILNQTIEPELCCEPRFVVPPISPYPMPFYVPRLSRKDCIRLNGLPYEAKVLDILEFFGESAKNILYQGVHIVYNEQGFPSGEAFIRMDSENSAFKFSQDKPKGWMGFGKRWRCIKVYQCSTFYYIPYIC